MRFSFEIDKIICAKKALFKIKMASHDHVIYKNDPILFRSYVNKRCTVTAADNSVHTGIVYTIDPVTESIVLIEEENTTMQRLKFVMGHAVKDVKVSPGRVDNAPRLFEQSTPDISRVSANERKLAVMHVLRENQFPILEIDDYIVMKGAFVIKPPYAIENCVSTHPTVLQNVRKILSRLT